MIMQHTLLLWCYAAVAAAKYTVPIDVEKALGPDCARPLEFNVTDYRMYDDYTDDMLDVMEFRVTDIGTGIETLCQRGTGSQPSSPEGAPAVRWPCNDPVIEFITQDGQLTIVERACPQEETSSVFEASGTITPNATCEDTKTSHACSFKIGQFQVGDFESLQQKPPPIPPSIRK